MSDHRIIVHTNVHSNHSVRKKKFFWAVKFQNLGPVILVKYSPESRGVLAHHLVHLAFANLKVGVLAKSLRLLIKFLPLLCTTKISIKNNNVNKH